MATPNEPQVSRETLCVHLDLVARATPVDYDELLTDLLARLYASLAIQNA
jgi:hypothetical protein